MMDVEQAFAALDDVEKALHEALMIGRFIAIVREESGIADEEELCALAHHWLDKVAADAGPKV